jgi:hypothetical protein
MGGYPCLLSFSGMADILKLPERKPLTADCDRSRILRTWAAACGGIAPMQRSIPFGEIRHLEPEEFVALLAHEMHAYGVVAGSNYRFGLLSPPPALQSSLWANRLSMPYNTRPHTRESLLCVCTPGHAWIHARPNLCFGCVDANGNMVQGTRRGEMRSCCRPRASGSDFMS